MPGTPALGWSRVASNWIQVVWEAARRVAFWIRGNHPSEICPNASHLQRPLALLGLLLASYALIFLLFNPRFYLASFTWVWVGMMIHSSVTFRLNYCNGGWRWGKPDIQFMQISHFCILGKMMHYHPKPWPSFLFLGCLCGFAHQSHVLVTTIPGLLWPSLQGQILLTKATL